jgi:hypothetical protein
MTLLFLKRLPRFLLHAFVIVLLGGRSIGLYAEENSADYSGPRNQDNRLRYTLS